MNSVEHATQDLQETLRECFEQIRFARAAELARSRRYLEAEGLLSPNGQVSKVPRELDLLARISAQQHDYERARILWEAALQQSPGNASYVRAIERTREAETSRAKFRKTAAIALLSLLAIAVAIAVWSFMRRSDPIATREDAQRLDDHVEIVPVESVGSGAGSSPPIPRERPLQAIKEESGGGEAAEPPTGPEISSKNPKSVPMAGTTCAYSFGPAGRRAQPIACRLRIYAPGARPSLLLSLEKSAPAATQRID